VGIAIGGSTGQALVKTSSTNYATQWLTIPTVTDFNALAARVTALEALNHLLLEG
jgi:hypothetical protein